MGDKTRCISEAVLYNDNFITLPATAKALYIYINQKTDDKGFCDEVASIMRTLCAKPKDLQLLIDRHFIIRLEDWLFLEKHFWINNKNLRKDRLKESRYEEYLDGFTIKENGSYTAVKPQPNDDKPRQNDTLTQHNITQHNITQGKDDLSKYKLMDRLTASEIRSLDKECKTRGSDIESLARYTESQKPPATIQDPYNYLLGVLNKDPGWRIN